MPPPSLLENRQNLFLKFVLLFKFHVSWPSSSGCAYLVIHGRPVGTLLNKINFNAYFVKDLPTCIGFLCKYYNAEWIVSGFNYIIINKMQPRWLFGLFQSADEQILTFFFWYHLVKKYVNIQKGIWDIYNRHNLLQTETFLIQTIFRNSQTILNKFLSKPIYVSAKVLAPSSLMLGFNKIRVGIFLTNKFTAQLILFGCNLFVINPHRPTEFGNKQTINKFYQTFDQFYQFL